MTIGVCQVGDLRRVTAVFKNDAGTATDPTAVSFKYTKPSGTTTTLVYLTDAALVKDSTGNYHVDLSVTEAGWWHYRFIGTGAVQAVEDGEFMVSPKAM
ncbi:MAG TPA: hypothetical protein VJ797_15520 [Burkholderiales bacterium]|nr:hypothetical protein [Burkholderiales bacterium]